MPEVVDERSDEEKAAHDGTHYLVALSLTVEATSVMDAVEQFTQWLDESGTGPVAVTVHPLPVPAGGFVEVEI